MDRMRSEGTPPGTLGIGVVGAGSVALRHHLPVLARQRGAEVVAIADPDAQSLAAALALAPAARGEATHTALLADPRVDVVAVLTPPASHAQIAIAALEAGRHVFLEKPLAASMDDARAIARAADEAGRVVGVGFVYRRHRLVTEALDLVRAGALGRLRSIIGTMTGAGRADPRRGGALLDLASHHVDLWRLFTGTEVTSAHAVAGNDCAVLSARMGDGTAVSVTVGDALGANHELRLLGDAGTITLRLDRFDGLDLVPAGALPGDPPLRLRRGLASMRSLPAMVRSHRAGGDLSAAFAAEWRDLLSAVRGERPFQPDASDGFLALEAILQAEVAG
ncbi:unannotated protein [freshwater metagenome]|uniref:Unannotated protein n=1 Tax=freshwater metagenome TaxID=449393 RepID=A0A6J7GYM1_9ZZZZ|nr:hypothetical protein [Actinomycetota bacterium]